jgi:LPXTG-site transpeptidase (sortase) family protein
MSTPSESLSISSLQQGSHKHNPTHAEPHHRPKPPDPENDPQAAAAARRRIEQLADSLPLPSPKKLPATPTADLITNKQQLAAEAAPLTSRRRKIPSALQPMLVAAGIFVLTLLLFKAPIIISQLGYSLGKKNTPAAAVTAGATVSADNTIDIPKINVHAPVVYEPSVDETAIENALQNGVVHYGNTALPGQNGNVAIFGHSSNDWWEPGNYKFVFVLLDKLAPGDTVTVNYNAHSYVYQVTGSQVVEPTDVGVLNPTATPTLSLITCSPPGTSLRRLVVTAKQVSPDPSQVTGTASKASGASGSGSSNLPSAAPGFLTQLRQAWDSTWHSLRSLVGADNSGPQPSPSASPDASGQIPAVK